MGEEDSHVQKCRVDFPALQRHSVRFRSLSKCLSCQIATSQLGSCSDLPREQSAPSGEDTVTEECAESHQSENDRKINANDKQSGEDTVTEECTESHQSENDNLGKNLTNMPEDHRMQSMDEEKAAFLATASRPCAPSGAEIGTISQSHTAGLVEKIHYKRLLHNHPDVSPISTCMFSLVSSWCHVLRTSAERNVTGRRDSANPRRTKEPNEKRHVNCWRNLKSATRLLSKHH